EVDRLARRCERAGRMAHLVHVAVALAVSCAAPLLHGCSDAPPASSGASGFVPEDVMQARRLEYLRFATQRLVPDSPVNVMAHMERARIDRGYSVPAGAVPADAWDRQLAK